MTNYRRGVAVERQAIDFLKENNYNVTHSAGSRGVFDIIAYNSKCVRFIQIKSTENTSYSYNLEIEKIKQCSVPENCSKELWIFVKRIGFVEFVGFTPNLEYPTRKKKNNRDKNFSNAKERNRNFRHGEIGKNSSVRNRKNNDTVNKLK